MLAWLSVWSEVQTCIWPSWCHCHSLSLASVKSRLVYLFGTGSPGQSRKKAEKGPLKRVCVCVCVCIIVKRNFCVTEQREKASSKSSQLVYKSVIVHTGCLHDYFFDNRQSFSHIWNSAVGDLTDKHLIVNCYRIRFSTTLNVYCRCSSVSVLKTTVLVHFTIVLL